MTPHRTTTAAATTSSTTSSHQGRGSENKRTKGNTVQGLAFRQHSEVTGHPCYGLQPSSTDWRLVGNKGS